MSISKRVRLTKRMRPAISREQARSPAPGAEARGTCMIDQQSPKGPHPSIYVYTDNFGEVVYRKVRRDRPKGFVWESPDGKGGWTLGLNDHTRCLYRLPELIASPDPVWLPEGEK